MNDRRRAFLASLAPEQRTFVPALLVGLADLIDELAAGAPSETAGHRHRG